MSYEKGIAPQALHNQLVSMGFQLIGGLLDKSFASINLWVKCLPSDGISIRVELQLGLIAIFVRKPDEDKSVHFDVSSRKPIKPIIELALKTINQL